MRGPASSSIKARSRPRHAWNFTVRAGRTRSSGSSGRSSEVPLSPGPACSRLACIRPARAREISGCPDSNWGPLRPERSALPGCATPRRSGDRLAEVPVNDGRARVFDVVHPGCLGHDPRLLGANAELQPERRSADRHRLPGNVRAELRSSEHVDEVDRLFERGQGRPVVGAERVDAQHPVADALEVARDAVARLRRVRRGADDGDRLRVPQDLLRAPHYHRTVPEEELVARWQLTLGEEYPPGAAGRAYKVDLADGTPAVLKVINPHREALQEADALDRWDGDGAVRLLDRTEDGL